MPDKAADCERAASAVREHVRKLERPLNAVRRTHRGRPVDEVRQALVLAVGPEGLTSGDRRADRRGSPHLDRSRLLNPPHSAGAP